MKADRKKLELAMARACMESRDLPAATGLPGPTVQNAIQSMACSLVPQRAA